MWNAALILDRMSATNGSHASRLNSLPVHKQPGSFVSGPDLNRAHLFALVNAYWFENPIRRTLAIQHGLTRRNT